MIKEEDWNYNRGQTADFFLQKHRVEYDTELCHLEDNILDAFTAIWNILYIDLDGQFFGGTAI